MSCECGCIRRELTIIFPEYIWELFYPLPILLGEMRIYGFIPVSCHESSGRIDHRDLSLVFAPIQEVVFVHHCLLSLIQCYKLMCLSIFNQTIIQRLLGNKFNPTEVTLSALNLGALGTF